MKRGAVFGGDAARYALLDATAKFVIVMDVVHVLAKPVFFFLFFLWRIKKDDVFEQEKEQKINIKNQDKLNITI